MTVETTTSRVSYTGAGTTGPFSVPFYFLDDNDLLVTKVTIATGAETTLTLTTDYTVSGAADEAGGSVTLVSALSSSYKLVIVRDPDFLQSANYPANDPFPSATHERVVDKLTMLAQRLKDLSDRSFRLSDGDTSGVGLELSSLAANNVITVNAAGTTLEGKAAIDVDATLVTAFVKTILDDADASTVLSTLGISAYIKTLLDDADAAAVLATLGLSSGTGSSLVGFTQAGTGAVSRTAQDKMRETVSVKDFGAVGDGTTDDAAAIQAAIDYATEMSEPGVNFPLEHPVKVLIPAGDYKITAGLTANRRVWISGEGEWATRLICTTTGASFYGLSLRPDASGGVPIWGAIIENLQIVGNGGATRCSGISTGSTAPYTISQSAYQNLIMYDVDNGLSVGDGLDNTFYGNRFFNIKVTGTGATGVTGYGLKVNSAVYNTFEGIEVTGTASTAYSFYVEGGWNSLTQLTCDGVSYMDIPNSTLTDFTVEGLIAATTVSGTALNINRASLLQNITLIDCPNSKTAYGLTTLGNGIGIYGYRIISTGAGQPNYVFAPAANTHGVLHGFESTNPPAFLIDLFLSAATMSMWHFAACPTLTYKGGYYNDAGSVTFSADTTVLVTFTKTQPDANYVVALAPQANKTFWVTAKATDGFTLNASASSSDSVDWSVTR